MMKLKQFGYLILFVVFFYGCDAKQEQPMCKSEYTFHRDSVKLISSINLKIDRCVEIDTANSIKMASFSKLCIDADDVFLYKYGYIYRFDLNGIFKNKVGEIGHGPGEYVELQSVTLDKSSKHVEALDSDGKLLIYSYDGKYLSKKNVPITATNLVNDGKSYWICSMPTEQNDDKSIYCASYNFKSLQGHVETSVNLGPVNVKDIGVGPVVTFCDAFSHEVYHLHDNIAELAYTFIFPNFEIPSSLIQSSTFEKFMEEMPKHDYIMIDKCLENSKYLYLVLTENHSDGSASKHYQWIIDKNGGRELIVSMDGVPRDSYIRNPQVLTDDNLLYFVGYPTIEEGTEFDICKNPSIISVDLSTIW